MRVLVIGGRFNNDDCEAYNGYAVAVRDITRSVGEHVETYVLPIEPRLPTLVKKRHMDDKITLLPRFFSWSLIYNSILDLKTSLESVEPYVPNAGGYGKALKRIWRTALYSIEYSYNYNLIERLIDRLKPDLIHIHGFTLAQLPYFISSFEKGVPLIATAHGLNSIDNKGNLWFDVKLEADLFKRMDESANTITVVSSGVKKDAISHFGISSDNIHVVVNGINQSRFKTIYSMSKAELRDKYGLQQEKKIILSVGSICKRKNQEAVLDALITMDSAQRTHLLYLIVGSGDSSSLHKKIIENELNDCVRIIGRVSDATLGDIYSLSDILIHTATSEGFGLVFLEAMAYGLPIITYEDMQATNELYDPDYMILVPARNPSVLARYIISAVNTSWDSNKIKKKTKHWNWGRIAEDYVELYYARINRGEPFLTVKEIRKK